ncbi:MAG TPA: RNA polymerase sigma factor [Terriglobales bacterium]
MSRAKEPDDSVTFFSKDPHQRRDPEIPGELADLPDEPSQLSEEEGVSEDMSTVAISGGIGIGKERPVNARVSDPAVLAGMTDAEIMLQVKTGDDNAFNFLIEKFRRPLISFMYRMTHNSAIAEELAQEVFLRIYRSRETYSADAKFTTWMYRIATNLAVNNARDSKYDRPEVKASLDETDEETGLAIDVADSTPNVEQQILRRERLAAIRQQIESLPERQRMAVLMHKYQNMDYKQIAEVLHLSESATKSLLFRAYESLREKLKAFI